MHDEPTMRPAAIRTQGLVQGLVALLAGVLALLGGARAALAAPASALVMPFDATAGSASFLVASHPADPAASGAVRTHWAYWDDACAPLLDALVCLPADATVVVDPTRIDGVAGARGDLSGRRGFVTVTAYDAAAGCAADDTGSAHLAGEALLGSFTLASLAAGVSFGGTAIALPLDPSGSFVDLPGGDGAYQSALRLPTFDPARLDVSRVILLALRERAGVGTFRAAELGPALDGSESLRAGVRFADKDGASFVLPDASFGCAAFTSLRREDVPTLIAPGGAGDAIASGGLLTLENPRAGDRVLGGTSWLFGFHAQAVGSFGVLAEGDALLGSHLAGTPTPRPSGTGGTPTPRASATATSGPSPSAVPTPVGSATPRATSSVAAPTATPAATPIVGPSATPNTAPTPGPTPSPGTSKTPPATSSPARSTTPAPPPSSTPDATATPAPTTAGATPTPSPAVTRTPAPSSSPAATRTPAGSCTTLTLQVRTAYGPSGSGDVSGVIATVAYPAAVTIPGGGGDASVVARVSNVSGVSGLFQVTDSDTTLRAGLISVSAAIPQGPFVRIVFDCASGALPPPGAFGCTLEASTLDGVLVPGAACTTEILP